MGATADLAIAFEEREKSCIFLIQLLEQALLAKVEGAPRLAVFRVSIAAVVPAPTCGTAGPRCLKVGDEFLRSRLPIAVVSPEWLLVVNGRCAPEILHQELVFDRRGFSLAGRGGCARTMRAKEIHLHGVEVFVQVRLADVATMRGGDQTIRVELACQFSEFLKVRKAREPLVPDVPFICQVQIPVAM